MHLEVDSKEIDRNASIKELNELLNNDPVLAEKCRTIEQCSYEPGGENKHEETNVAFDRYGKRFNTNSH